MTALTRDRGDLGGDRVQPAEIVEQPAVDAVGRQRRLDGRDVERRRRDSEGMRKYSLAAIGSSIGFRSARLDGGAP